MKQCPRCKQTYGDENLNFCLEDGELLSVLAYDARPSRYADDPPPTVVLSEARVTNPASWPQSSPVHLQPQHIQRQPFLQQSYSDSRDQTLPTISLILGIASVVLICCYGGIWLGLPAAVLGYLGMRNIDADSQRYTGRGMAVAGLVMGGVTLLVSIINILIIFFSIMRS
jgi:hypothetical protein